MRKKIPSIILFMAACTALFPTLGQDDLRVEIYDLRPYTHPTFTRIAVDVGKLRSRYPDIGWHGYADWLIEQDADSFRKAS